MSKIINTKTSEIIMNDSDQYISGVVMDYLENYKGGVIVWERISDLVMTTAGDASTPFNTIGEMIQNIPDIVNYGEETAILCVFADSIDYYVLGWDYEGNETLWNTILQKYFPELKAIEE